MTKMTLKFAEIRKFAISGAILVGLAVSAGLTGCQGTTMVDEKSPLSSKIVRLGDTSVAEIDGTSIYLSDIEHAALAKGVLKQGGSLTPKDPLFQSTLDELIDQRLLALEALRQSLDQNDETRRRLALARERILANIVVEKLLAEKVTDENIQRMYDEQQSLQGKAEQVRARHIVVETEKLALELKELLETGGDFSALAKEFSIDQSTRDLGGDLGYFSANAMEDVISSTAFALDKGSISEPFKTQYGWHILQTVDRRAMPRPTLKTIRPEIVQFMTYEEIQKLLKSLRSSSDIQLKTGQKPIPETPPKTPPEDKPVKESKDAP